MNSMDFDSLKQDLQTYMLRSDSPFVDQLDTIIQQGIIRIYNNANDIGFELNYLATLPIERFLVDKPGNWRETISFSIVDASGNKTFLQERTYEYCRTYLPNVNLTGTPKYYCEIPSPLVKSNSYGSWSIVPTADVSYTVTVIYLGIPLFDENHATNFLTARYPSLLLYSCLMEASLFLDNEEKRAKYEAMFGKELETINNMNVNRTTDRTVTRDKS